MKALVYEKAHKLEDFAIDLVDVAEPTLRDTDVVVEVHAIGVNPGEAFFRSVRSAEPGGRVLLGGLLHGPGGSAGTKLFHQRRERLRSPGIAEDRLMAECECMLGDCLGNYARSKKAYLHDALS